jgi:hypothetical protein
MRMYFAGPDKATLAEAVKGQRVLESFARIWTGLDRYRKTYPSMMLDSGAFSEINSGVAIDINEYGAFAAKHQGDYDHVVNLDDISGDIERSSKNERHLRERWGLDPMPVFHQGEPMSVLDEYCSRAKTVGLGFKRPLTSRIVRHDWLSECFARIPSGQATHGFAMTGYMSSFPFASVDSTTWIREYMDIAFGRNGQVGTLAKFLTPGEVLEIVVKKWDRMPRCTSWDGPGRPSNQLALFDTAER